MNDIELLMLVRKLATRVGRDVEGWKDMAQRAYAALNLVEEAVGQLLPVTIRSGDHRPDPEPLTQATDIIAGLHQLRAQLEKPE